MLLDEFINILNIKNIKNNLNSNYIINLLVIF